MNQIHSYVATILWLDVKSASRHRLLALLFSLSLLVPPGCNSPSQGAQGVAESFVDQHYVMIDLEAAKKFTSGLAERKIEREQSLIVGQTIDDTTMKPKVHYKLIEKREAAGQPAFLFEGTIYSSGSDPFTRQWLVSTRQEGTNWKVSNFEELDQPEP